MQFWGKNHAAVQKYDNPPGLTGTPGYRVPAGSTRSTPFCPASRAGTSHLSRLRSGVPRASSVTLQCSRLSSAIRQEEHEDFSYLTMKLSLLLLFIFALVDLSLAEALTGHSGFVSGRAEVPGSKITAKDITKSEVFDGTGMCNNPKWKTSKLDKRMVAWKGPDLAFLTLASHQDQFDDGVIKSMVARLHRGWSAYAFVMRDKPLKGKNFEEAAAIVAIPRNTAVAIGQGWMGHQGIDVATFYDKGYAKAETGEVEGYYFYEMGRNWFTGSVWRKFAYDSAFAVHMGAVAHAYAMDRPRAPNGALLKKIKDSKVDFSKLISYDRATSKALGADFNVFYSEMLIMLSKGDLGWVKNYYRHLLDTANHGGNKHLQIINWMVASCAADRDDVTPQFVETLHVPLSRYAIDWFGAVDWKNPSAVASFYRSGFDVKKCFN